MQDRKCIYLSGHIMTTCTHLPFVFCCSDFWVHLESLTELLIQMIVQVQKLDSEIKATIQMHLQYISDHQISVLEWQKRTAQDKLTIPLEGHGKKFQKSSVDLNKAILYLMKGFIPLLSGFSSKLCAHICGQNMECTKAVSPQKMQILHEFTKALQVSSCQHSYMHANIHSFMGLSRIML